MACKLSPWLDMPTKKQTYKTLGMLCHVPEFVWLPLATPYQAGICCWSYCPFVYLEIHPLREFSFDSCICISEIFKSHVSKIWGWEAAQRAGEASKHWMKALCRLMQKFHESGWLLDCTFGHLNLSPKSDRRSLDRRSLGIVPPVHWSEWSKSFETLWFHFSEVLTRSAGQMWFLWRVKMTLKGLLLMSQGVKRHMPASM